LVALPAGAVVDRWRLRGTLVAAHVSRCVVTPGLAALVLVDGAGVGALAVCGFLLGSAETLADSAAPRPSPTRQRRDPRRLGSAETFADSAGQSLLVAFAGPADLERANGRLVGVETVGVEIAGPLAAAALLARDPVLCFAVDALALGCAAGLLTVVPSRPAAAPGPDRGPLAAEVRSGLRYLVRHRVLRTPVGVSA
ncbi:hypothetical protein ACFFRS_22845, partial [Saccharopolyspora hordei]